MIAIAIATETDRTSAVRDMAEGSKNRSLRGVLQNLFRQAAKAVGQEVPDVVPETAQRSGQTEGEFKRLVRVISRRVDVRARFRDRARIASRAENIPEDAFEFAHRCAGESWDQASQWQCDEWNSGQEIDFAEDVGQYCSTPEI